MKARSLFTAALLCLPALVSCQSGDPGESQGIDLGQTSNALSAAVCGNGLLESGEQCDDRNTLPGDGCSPACQVEPYFTCTDIRGWGRDDYGRARVQGPLSQVAVVAVAAGESHSLALKSDGTVVAWGSNYFGETSVPSRLSGVVAVAAGAGHNVALKSDGTVVAWGRNDNGQTCVPAGLSGVVAVAAGAGHNLALKSDGTVVAWGRNESAQASVPTGLSGVVAVAAGAGHNLALKSDGTVVAWGFNGGGQTSVPSWLSGVAAVAAGGLHSLALKSDGTVVAWGRDDDGQTFVPVAGLSGVLAVAAGRYHSLALKSDGTVVAWGGNDDRQIDVPEGLRGVVALAAGPMASHVLVVTNSCSSLASVVVTRERSGANCAAGGQKIEAYASDLSLTVAYVCNGTGGQSANVSVTDEPAGNNCPNGGQKIETRIGTGPVVTSYVCNGSNGPGVVEVAEAPGDNCDYGGVKVTSGGIDRYVCNGAASLVATEPEPPGTNCEAGGTRIATGLDQDGDGSLDAEEVSSTAYACNGVSEQGCSAAGAGVGWFALPAIFLALRRRR